MTSVSIIIPARNEVYLEKTIRNVLSNAEGDIEIIAILDGYIPDPQIVINDNRVIFVHFEKPIGQRAAINQGARMAQGKYIMKLDAHCMVDKGFDVKLAKDCEYDWTVIPRMYNLDIEQWQPKLHKRTDYMYIGDGKGRELRAEYYNRGQPKNDKLIDDTMCCMGPCFFMHKDRYWELEGLDEDHGGWGQMGVEIACKAWLSGGSLKVNKNTWFAHWFRGGGGPGFPYSISGRDQEKARQYSKDLWLNNKWPLQERKFEWLIEKFKPPTWEDKLPRPRNPELPNKVGLESLTPENKKLVDDFNKLFFEHWNRYPRKWLGTHIVKYPADLFLYQMIMYQNKPDILIETGSYLGGGALFFASMFDLIGKGQVISIDRRELKRPQHPRITYVIGRSTEENTLAKVKEIVGDKSCMVILDSDHRRQHVKRELYHYSKLVTTGQYLVCEDTMLGHIIDWKYGVNTGPLEAVRWFMERNKKRFTDDHLELHYLVSMSPNGWLRRIA